MSSDEPAALARAALRQIAQLQIPPTPENFERQYHLAAGRPAESRTTGVDPRLAERVAKLVDMASTTAERLTEDLGRGEDDLTASLESLIEAPPTDTAALLQAVVASTRAIQSAVQVSHAELLEARQSLADIKTELVESRRLLGQDPLTGTDNRRALTLMLDREVVRCRRDDEPLALAVLDIDHFKKINDTLGHEGGDAALVHFSRIAKAMLRGNDAFVRYGGEEFVLVLPETALQGGVFAVERLQVMLRKRPFVFEGRPIAMTFSAGVAMLNEGDTEKTLIRRADAALYEAKRTGRNRVVAAP